MGGWLMLTGTHATCALAGLGLLIAAGLAAAQAPKPGDVVFATSFDTDAERQAWPAAPFAEWADGVDGSQALRVHAEAGQESAAHMASMQVDLEPLRGCKLLLECMAKAEDVSKPPRPYLGAKFMLHYLSEANGPFWQNQNDVYGTFDWKKLSFVASIAPDATGGQISLGLQESSGTVTFDNIRISVYKTAPPARPQPPANPGPVFKGHNLPRLRGVMSPNAPTDEDLRVLGQEWNANVIRRQITRNWGKPGTDRDLAEYDQWLDGKLA